MFMLQSRNVRHAERFRVPVKTLVALWCAFQMFVISEVHANTPMVQTRSQQQDAVGSYHWTLEAPSGVTFEFIQRVPDQTRSFYLARGFSAETADRYATACVFQTIVKNGSQDHELSIDLKDWKVRANGTTRPLTLTEQWLDRWKTSGVSKTARIAFRWSQFPTVQHHAPGDWFQGMIAAEVPPTSKFDLVIHWREGGKQHTAMARNLQCARDRTLIK